MQITTSAYNEMLQTVGSRPAESGGLLFGSRKDWVVTHFIYDKNAKTTSTSYTFDVGYLNPIIEKLSKKGLQLLGFFHSHPQNYKQLSAPDRSYFQSQFANISVEKFLVPLMFPAVDGTYDFIPYIYHKNGEIEQTTLELLPDNYKKFNLDNTTIMKSFSGTTPNKKLSVRETHKMLLIAWHFSFLLFSMGILYEFYRFIAHLLNP